MPVKAVDTTGAGDMYAAGVLYGLTHGMTWKQAGQLASHAAARIVSQMGARLDRKFTPDEIRQLAAVIEREAGLARPGQAETAGFAPPSTWPGSAPPRCSRAIPALRQVLADNRRQFLLHGLGNGVRTRDQRILQRRRTLAGPLVRQLLDRRRDHLLRRLRVLRQVRDDHVDGDVIVLRDASSRSR